MSDTSRNLPIPNLFAPEHGVAAQTDIEWERIMVQITFAFVIILGYLISVSMKESQNLAAETELYRRHNVALRSIVADYKTSELGQERTQRIAAQQQLKLEKLLNTWQEIRKRRLFYMLLVQFREAEFIPLSDDLPSLPTGTSFQQLNAEIDRIFLSGKHEVAPDEVNTLMDAVVTAAGYDLTSARQTIDPEELPPELIPHYDPGNELTRDDLNRLKHQIVGDLNEERGELVDVQYALVGKIAAARLEKLAVLPLDAETDADVDVDAPDLGSVMLERILSDLRNGMRLLPETAERIRGTSDANSTSEQE